MYKILIVDDEETIRNGLKYILPWEQYGFQVIGTAKDGQDALKKLNQYSVDLMIVDIRMPGMNGIELMKHVNQLDPNIQFIILSGYAEFEYAKKAIEVNASGYLLKPVDEEELIEQLNIVHEKLEEIRLVSDLKQDKKSEEKEHILGNILKKVATKEIEAKLAKYNLLWNRYQLLLIKFLSIHEIQKLSNMKNELKQMFEPHDGFVFQIDQYCGILLRGCYTTLDELKGLYRKVANGTNKDQLMMSISFSARTPEQLPALYDECKQLLEKHFFYKNYLILNRKSKLFVTKQERKSSQSVQKLTHLLIQTVEVANRERMEDLTLEIAQNLVHDDCSEQEIKNAYFKIMSTVLSHFSERRAETKKVVAEIFDKLYLIHETTSLEHLLKIVNDFLQSIICKIQPHEQKDHMAKIIDYIHHNYYQNLKLKTIAKLFHYNSAYLGKLFKSYTGEYFNTYLDKVRIEKAKQFLSQGFKVYEVAEKVGYRNVDYFHYKFKRYTDMSPSDYRKTLVKNNQ